ncbi:MAG: hypothetical protein M0R06_06050 [Sphaerochaeta sp.]|jgi:hypothetical protein|nr:hypothetical protein [Sphaerochaeta sp.]
MRLTKTTITKTWITGAGHAAETQVIGGVSGKLVGVRMWVSEVTGDPDVTVTITDEADLTLFSSGAKNDATNYRFGTESEKATQDADFDPTYFVNEALTVSIDPSADAGGTAQTLTVIVDVYILQYD